MIHYCDHPKGVRFPSTGNWARDMVWSAMFQGRLSELVRINPAWLQTIREMFPNAASIFAAELAEEREAARVRHVEKNQPWGEDEG